MKTQKKTETPAPEVKLKKLFGLEWVDHHKDGTGNWYCVVEATLQGDKLVSVERSKSYMYFEARYFMEKKMEKEYKR